MSRFLLLLLGALSLPALAQLECNPSAPRTDPGTGFTPFATLERLEVRSGRLGAAGWEWGLGVNTQSAGQFVTANLDWVNDKIYDWTLSYSGSGSATMEVRDGGTVLFTRTWPSGMDAGNALKLYVKSSSGIPAGTRVTATSATLIGQPAAGMLQTAGTGDFSEQSLYWFYPPMSQGFIATGTVKLTFSGSYPPTGSRLNFIVTAGNIPCTAPPAQAKLYYIHVDHLNTPRLIADEQQRTVWRWDNTDPFGGNPPDENPSGLGVFEFPLRFPGQYFDRELNTHYNLARDYDPAVGRYIQADPIGLRGGLNTYAYAVGDPLKHADPLGLAIWLCNRQVRIPPFVGNHAYLWNDKTQRCCGRDQGRDPMNDCREWGPPIDSCVLVAGSPGKEDEIMKCCQETANTGRWIPFINDCVDSAQRCIEKFGLTYPGAPGGRVGQCDSCYQKPPTAFDPPFLR